MWPFGSKIPAKIADKLHKMKLGILELAKEIDMINEKMRSPLIKKKIKDKAEEADQPEEKSSIHDGFDEVRQLRKDLNMNRS